MRPPQKAEDESIGIPGHETADGLGLDTAVSPGDELANKEDEDL